MMSAETIKRDLRVIEESLTNLSRQLGQLHSTLSTLESEMHFNDHEGFYSGSVTGLRSIINRIGAQIVEIKNRLRNIKLYL